MLATLPVPAGTSWNLLYAAVGSARTVAEVSLCNTDKTQEVAVGLAVTSTSTAPTAGASSPASTTCAVYEFGRALGQAGIRGNSPLTRALVLQPSQRAWVQADKAGVSAAIDGQVE